MYLQILLPRIRQESCHWDTNNNVKHKFSLISFSKKAEQSFSGVLLLLLIPWIEGAVSNFFWQKICTRPSCKKPYNSLHKISDKIVNPRSWWGETITESKSSLASTHYKTHNQKTLRIISDVEQLPRNLWTILIWPSLRRSPQKNLITSDIELEVIVFLF